MMRNVLSQAEIDELVKAVSSGEKSLDEIRIEHSKPNLRRYDFRRPNKFSKTHINALNMIHQNFSRVMSSYLSGFLRNTVDIKVASVEQLTFGDFIVSIDTTLAIIFEINDMGSAIMEISLPVVFPVLELMLGGNGQQSKVSYRPLTDLEMSVMQKLSDRILERYSVVWNNGDVDVAISKQSLESNLRLIYTISPDEIIILITLSAQINNSSGLINICLPFTALESILGKLTSHVKQTGLKSERIYLKEHPDQMVKCPLRLTALAGKVPMTVRDLLELEVGDIVFVDRDISQEFDLLVEGRQVYSVQAGFCNGKKAVRVMSVSEE